MCVSVCVWSGEEGDSRGKAGEMNKEENKGGKENSGE